MHGFLSVLKSLPMLELKSDLFKTLCFKHIDLSRVFTFLQNSDSLSGDKYSCIDYNKYCLVI